MGVVSVLFMMAAAGITYGWQPDERGGVEYIIQIPPDQLQELERLGGTVIHTQTVQAKRRPVRAWIDAVRARFVSTLQMLSDQEIEDGLGRLVASTPDLDVDLEYTMIWERLSARF